MQPDPSKLLSLAKAARAFSQGRRGSPMAPSTLFRLATQGEGGLRLRTWHLQGALRTTIEEVLAFFEARAKLRTQRPSAPPAPTSGQGGRA